LFVELPPESGRTELFLSELFAAACGWPSPIRASCNFRAVQGYFAAALGFVPGRESVPEFKFALKSRFFAFEVALVVAVEFAGLTSPEFVAKFVASDELRGAEVLAFDFAAPDADGNSIVMGDGRVSPLGPPAMSCGMVCVSAAAA